MLVVHPEVASALAAGRPVVALESTIITHGMPHPHNVETALAVEAVVREGGAVPATIAVIEGRIHVGLAPEAIAELGRAKDVLKCSRRDLATVVATGRTGSTTVAGTMIVAARAGIRVFVTGGIGGVHRGAETTMDVSADLLELGRTSVAVVCAGAKSILDIGLTLEVLETHGVPVLGYRTDRFPAFYVRDSGHGVDVNVPDAATVAKILAAKAALGIEGGTLVTVPIPEADALGREEVEAAIAAALAEAEAEGVKGKALTPFLLARMRTLTGGRSLAANMSLIRHNAAVGAAIAVELAKLEL